VSDEDKSAYKKLLLIAVLAIFAILLLFAIGTLFATYGCFDLYLRKITPIPEGCGNGNLSKFVLEFMGLVIGTLGAIKLLGQ
jgi:hypothetical protein